MRTIHVSLVITLVADVQLSLEKMGGCDTTLVELGRVIVLLLNGKAWPRSSTIAL